MALTLASNAITFTDSTALSSGIITSAQLSAGSVTTTAIASGAITTQTIANSAVTAEKMSGGQTGNAPVYGCRAWVNFDGGAGSTVDGEFRCTIRGNGNVSKVVRAGGATGTDTGVYLVTLATPMENLNYAVNCSIKAANDTSRHMDFISTRPESSSVIRIVCSAPLSPFNGINPGVVMVTVFG